MNKETIEDCRAFIYDELQQCQDGSYPAKERALSNLLIMTTKIK